MTYREVNAVTGLKACPMCGDKEILSGASSISGQAAVWCSLCGFGVSREAWQGGILEARSEWNREDLGQSDPDD